MNFSNLYKFVQNMSKEYGVPCYDISIHWMYTKKVDKKKRMLYNSRHTKGELLCPQKQIYI